MPIAIAFFVPYAYSILFLWVLIEQLGIPIPSIPVLLTAGTLSATHRIYHSYSLFVGLVACVLADRLWDWLGRRYRNKLLRLLCRLSFAAATCLMQTGAYFTRCPPLIPLLLQFVPW